MGQCLRRMLRALAHDGREIVGSRNGRLAGVVCRTKNGAVHNGAVSVFAWIDQGDLSGPPRA